MPIEKVPVVDTRWDNEIYNEKHDESESSSHQYHHQQQHQNRQHQQHQHQQWQFKTRNTCTIATDISVTVLTTLKEVAQASGMIPYLGLAAALALEIVTAAQATKDNKADFRRLTCDVCSLVTSISAVCIQMQAEGQELSPMLNEHLEMLLDTLTQIKQFAEKRAGKAYWKRYLSARSDTGTIQEFRERLRQALDVFGVQSHITVRESVVRMANRQESFHEDLKETLFVPPPRRQSPEPQTPEPEPETPKSRNPFAESVDSRNTNHRTPSPTSSFDDAFKDILASATITGNVTVNNIVGDSHVSGNMSRRSYKNVGNVVRTTSVNSNNNACWRGQRYRY